MSSSSVHFDFRQPSGGFSMVSPQEEEMHSMKMMMNMQQLKLNHLSSRLGQSNHKNDLQTTQDNQSTRSLSQSEVSFPRQQFPEKLYHMLELADAQGFGPSSNAVSWLPNGRAFSVRDEKVFMESIVPLFFHQTKLRSFNRQLNLWGFKRLNTGDFSRTYCHEHFVRGSPEELRFMVRIRIKSKPNVNQKKPVDLPLKVNEKQLQHREDDCTQVSHGSLSDISFPPPIPGQNLKSRRVSMESIVPCPTTSQYLVAEPSSKRQASIKDDDEPDGMSRVGISRHDPVLLASNEGLPRMDEFEAFIDNKIHLV